MANDYCHIAMWDKGIVSIETHYLYLSELIILAKHAIENESVKNEMNMDNTTAERWKKTIMAFLEEFEAASKEYNEHKEKAKT